MPRTQITRYDIRLACPGVDPHALSARYIPLCTPLIPRDDVESGMEWLIGALGGYGIFDEVPSGAKDGANLLFTTAHDYIAGHLRVHLNGLRLHAPLDFSEGPGTDKFTMVYPLYSCDVITVDYGYTS